MLTKLKNRLLDLGGVVVVFLFILLLPVLMVGWMLVGLFIPSTRAAAKFKEDYDAWLSKHEGEEFFCYTSRNNSVEEIENHLIPTFNDSIHVVKLVGKEPHSNLEQKFISHSLYNLENVGFPNVMKIINGKMHDLSMHSPVYDAINQGRSAELPKLVLQTMIELRGAEKT